MLDTPPFTSVNSTMEQFSPLAPQLPVWRNLEEMVLVSHHTSLVMDGREAHRSVDPRKEEGTHAMTADAGPLKVWSPEEICWKFW